MHMYISHGPGKIISRIGNTLHIYTSTMYWKQSTIREKINSSVGGKNVNSAIVINKILYNSEK